MSILDRTGFFRPCELRIAEEVLDDALATGTDGNYQSYVAVERDNVIGWICFGPTPWTIGTFDIYWLAVEPAKQRCGIGFSLVEFATELISRCGGRIIAVDTSGSSRYDSTRRFYEKMGYRQAARIRNFYNIGDDKVVYIKKL